MIKLDKMEQQIILYSKKWFKVTNQIEDLKVIVGDGLGIDPEDVGVWSIYYWVTNTYLRTIPQQYLINHMETFFLEMHKYKLPNEGVTREDLIQQMCSRLSILQVRDGDTILVELGESDYDLLPSKDMII